MTAPARVRLALVGFGAVGRAFARLLAQEGERIRAQERLDLSVTAVATRRFGAAADPGGLDLEQLLRRARDGERHGPPLAAQRAAVEAPADVIVETLPLDPHTGGEALAVTRAALAAGRSVVSANKGPVAHALPELRELARRHGVGYRFESAVADGLPVFSLVEMTLPCARIERVTATLNSTTNVVLAALLDGAGIAAGVRAAQAAGFAEADVAHDLDGWDAAVKLSALAAGLWSRALPPREVVRMPVAELGEERLAAVRARGGRLRGIATLQLADGVPAGRVAIEEVAPDHPFYALSGASLALRLESALISPITVSSTDPTPLDTAYGLLADVVHLCRPHAVPPQMRQIVACAGRSA